MRIRIIQKPAVPSIDGIQLDFFEVGYKYDVGHVLGALLLAEGWAEPVGEAGDAAASPNPGSIDRTETVIDPENPPNLRREIYPPVFARFEINAAADAPPPARRDDGAPNAPKPRRPRRFRR